MVPAIFPSFHLHIFKTRASWWLNFFPPPQSQIQIPLPRWTDKWIDTCAHIHAYHMHMHKYRHICRSVCDMQLYASTFMYAMCVCLPPWMHTTIHAYADVSCTHIIKQTDVNTYQLHEHMTTHTWHVFLV